MSIRKASVLIRPEYLSLEQDASSVPSSRNSLPVTIADISYLGSSVRYIVRMHDGSEGIVRTGTTGGVHSVGDDVVMTWEINRGVVFSGTESADG